jgi:hypothetical protein
MQKRENNIRITVDVKNGDGIVNCYSKKQTLEPSSPTKLEKKRKY